MREIRIIVLILVILIWSSICSAVQEKQSDKDGMLETRSLTDHYKDDAALPELNDTSTLDDYVLYAVLNNQGLRAGFNRWRASLEKITPARTLPDPRFTYSYYIEEVETRLGPQKHKFGIMQTFPWFGKLNLKGNIAAEIANGEKQKFEVEKLALIYKVKKIYFEYYYLGRSIEVTQDNLTLLNYLESVTRAKYRGGKGRQDAVLRAQVELGKIEDRLNSLRDMTKPVKAKLNTALNRPVDAFLPLPKTFVMEKIQLEDEALVALLRSNHPQLKRLDYMEKKEDLSVKLAEKNYYPDVSIGLNYIQTDQRTDMDPEGNGRDPVIGMLSFNIPIWQRKYDSIKTSAIVRRNAVLKERSDKENLLIAELESALYGYRDAGRKITLYRDRLIPKAEQTMEVTQAAFTTGKAGFLDLIDSQRILLEFQLSLERALTDQAQYLAEIEMLTGGEPK